MKISVSERTGRKLLHFLLEISFFLYVFYILSSTFLSPLIPIFLFHPYSSFVLYHKYSTSHSPVISHINFFYSNFYPMVKRFIPPLIFLLYNPSPKCCISHVLQCYYASFLTKFLSCSLPLCGSVLHLVLPILPFLLLYNFLL